MKIYFDLETTGYGGLGYFHKLHRIIQIGAVTEGGRTFKAFVNPQTKIDARSTNFHGISDDDVVQAETFNKVWKRFMEDFVSYRPSRTSPLVLIAHNCFGFDQLIIEKELHRFGLSTGHVEFQDTEPTFRYQFPCLKSYNLAKMVKHFIPNYHFRAHDALEDAKALRALCQQVKMRTYSFHKLPKAP